MEDKQQMDETLAAVTQFLSEYEAPAVAVADAAPIPAVDELLLASQLLVTETEASLAQASVDLHEAEAPPTDENASEDSDRSAAAQQQSKAERRRKITNAQAAKRRVKYLRRVKDKRETLKRQVRELSDELERRKVAQQRAKQEAERADALTLSVWRATCVRQKERRLESEGSSGGSRPRSSVAPSSFTRCTRCCSTAWPAASSRACCRSRARPRAGRRRARRSLRRSCTSWTPSTRRQTR